MDLDTLFSRVMAAASAGIPLEAIHDTVIAAGATEEDFFLCWKAAETLYTEPSYLS